MKRYLADVNVWFALAVEEHQHHASARQWWEETPGVFGFVRVTQLGLLGLLTSPGPMRGRPLTNEEAWMVWDGFLFDERVRVFPELLALGGSIPCLVDRSGAFAQSPGGCVSCGARRGERCRVCELRSGGCEV